MTSHRRSIGGWLAVCVLVAGIGAVIVSAPARTSAVAAQSAPPTPGGPSLVGPVSQASGADLYVANCATCHGPQGQGTAAGPPLTASGAAGADFYLRTGRMPLGAPGQQAQRHDPVFDEQQIQALVAHVASFGRGPAIPQVSTSGNLNEGWRLYTANCAACHAATGSGNAVGGGFTAVGLSHADPQTIAEAMIIGPGPMPVFNFPPDQRDAIVAYVRFLQDAPSPGGLPIGGFGPVSEGFFAVAIGLVLVVLAAMFTGRRSHRGEPAGLVGAGEEPASAGPADADAGATR